MKTTTHGGEHPVVLFDGVCNLCAASVQFVLARDPRGRFHFASLQSDAGRALLVQQGFRMEGEALRSIVLVDVNRGRVHTRSSAALRIAWGLRWGWPLLAVLLAVPRPIRDAVYDFIARHRYRWFGKRDACWLPTPELKGRFLDTAAPAGQPLLSPEGGPASPSAA